LRRQNLLLILPLLLATCSSTHKDRPSKPGDEASQRDQEAGQLALSLDRPQEAAANYRSALRRAQTRDDLPAIGDYGYDLIVALLRANDPAAARAVAVGVRAELARRGAAPFPAFDLAEATALYRAGARAQADAMAAHVERRDDPQAARQAAFLRGLIADETGDAAGLAAALRRIGPITGDTDQTGAADAAELTARLDLTRRQLPQAQAAALRAADLRRTLSDYRGMARALALAARAASEAGDSDSAADLYLRAGRSEADQGDPVLARIWLTQAFERSSDPTLRQSARRALSSLAPK
jgi:hypothetical protein